MARPLNSLFHFSRKLSVELAAERDATLRREMAAAEKRKRAAQQKLMGREHSAPPGSPPDPPQPEAAPSTRGGKKLTFMRSEPAAEHASRHQSPAPEVSGTATSFHSPLQRSRTGHSLPDRSYSVAPMQRAAGLEQARTVYVDMLKTHSEWRQSGITITLRHRISLIAYRLLCQRWFDGLMTFLIVLNTVMMAAQHYQQSQAQTDFSNYVNYIITGVFALEMVRLTMPFRAFCAISLSFRYLPTSSIHTVLKRIHKSLSFSRECRRRQSCTYYYFH